MEEEGILEEEEEEEDGVFLSRRGDEGLLMMDVGCDSHLQEHTERLRSVSRKFYICTLLFL